MDEDGIEGPINGINCITILMARECSFQCNRTHGIKMRTNFQEEECCYLGGPGGQFISSHHIVSEIGPTEKVIRALLLDRPLLDLMFFGRIYRILDISDIGYIG